MSCVKIASIGVWHLGRQQADVPRVSLLEELHQQTDLIPTARYYMWISSCFVTITHVETAAVPLSLQTVDITIDLRCEHGSQVLRDFTVHKSGMSSPIKRVS